MSDDITAARAFTKLLAVVTELRDRCPWDREQTLADTPRHLIEEAYEVADAIIRGNPPDVAEELGDAIVQCLFTGVILAEQSRLDIATVMQNAADKLIRRHPHVYGDTHAETSEQVLENWERIKADERASKNAGGTKSLAHVGRGLPSMMRAEKLGEKARRAGMDWANIRDVLAKAREELDEVEQALDRNDTDRRRRRNRRSDARDRQRTALHQPRRRNDSSRRLRQVRRAFRRGLPACGLTRPRPEVDDAVRNRRSVERSKSRQLPMNQNWTLACQFSKNYNRLGPVSPFIQSGNGLAFVKANAGPFLFQMRKSR